MKKQLLVTITLFSTTGITASVTPSKCLQTAEGKLQETLRECARQAASNGIDRRECVNRAYNQYANDVNKCRRSFPTQQPTLSPKMMVCSQKALKAAQDKINKIRELEKQTQAAKTVADKLYTNTLDACMQSKTDAAQ